MEYNHSYASKGVAGTGLGLGIAGTALGLMASGNGCGNNGILGGLFGGHNDCYVSQKENDLSIALAIAQSEKAATAQSKHDMERLFQESRVQDAKIADGLIQTGNALGVLNAEVACLKESVARNREEGFRNLQDARTYADSRVDAEAQLRHCEDEKTYLWVQAQNYVPAVLRVDPNQICGPSPVVAHAPVAPIDGFGCAGCAIR